MLMLLCFVCESPGTAARQCERVHPLVDAEQAGLSAAGLLVVAPELLTDLHLDPTRPTTGETECEDSIFFRDDFACSDATNGGRWTCCDCKDEPTSHAMVSQLLAVIHN